MKTKLIKYTSACFLIICYLLTGCVGLEINPHNKYSDETFWSSIERANALLSMGYNQMMSSGRIFRYERISDNLYNGYGNPTERLIQTGLATTSTNIFADEWKDSYGGIKTTHTFLANIDRLDADEALIERMKAEMRFIRVFIYFRLTNWYGDIPFFTEDIEMETALTITRTPQSKVIEFLHKELDEIAEILPAKYEGADRGRITSGAAVALNARIALNFNNWDKVIECTDKLINSTKYGEYDLFEDYQGIFFHDNQYNKEIILDIQYAKVHRTWSEIFAYVPMSLEGVQYINASPTQDLIDSYIMLDGSKWDENQPMYDDRDPRMDMTIVRHNSEITTKDGESYLVNVDPAVNPDKNLDYVGRENGSRTGYFYRKYYDPNPDAWTNGTSWSCNINIPTIRFADVLLMYAEAMYEKGQMNTDVWNKTIRRLRERAGFPANSAALNFPGNNSDLQEIIRNERRVELALEGLRIFDIRRWDIAHVVLSKPFRGAKFNNGNYFEYAAGKFGSRDYLWPVPQSELQINPNLGQNPGY